MIRRTWLSYAALALTFTFAALCLADVATAQQPRDRQEGELICRNDDNNNNTYRRNGNRLVSHCEIREQTIAAAGGTISVDGRRNGGVSIKGWDRNTIFVRARVQTGAITEAEARELAEQISIETGNRQIRADGPNIDEDSPWSVSYEVYVPRESDLSLKTYNGGISITDVRGEAEFTALNGGVSLKRLGGSVRGQTTNGGLAIDLAGSRWDGEGLDVKTTNGGVSIAVPADYSARLETGTVNGNLSIDFPVTVQGRLTKELSVNLGAGGPLVRATTTNGGVSIKRQ